MSKSTFFILFIFLAIGCNNDELVNIGSSSDCEYIHSVGISLVPMQNSILVNYGFFNLANSPVDPPPAAEQSCEPETIEISISTDGENFDKVATVKDINGEYLIEDLNDGDFISVKIEGSHPDLSTVSATRIAIIGEIELPQFLDHPLPMEDFNLANDRDEFIYRTSSDNWYLSSLTNQLQGQLVFEDVTRTRWNPNETNKVAGIEYILVQILPNTNGQASKYMVEYDLNTGAKTVLHEIKDNMDFNNDVYSPENYWIHEFHYSLDGKSIYFISNKDNGGSSIFDQEVFDNIWKLDLANKEIEVLSDFLPLNFDLTDFVEDPKQRGNFYISGGERDVQIEIDGNEYQIDREDIYYYNTTSQTITPVLISDEKIEYLNINPTGEHLIFTTKNSGKYELRSINTSNQKQKQLTLSDAYRPLNKWSHINWISNNEFMTTVIKDGNNTFAIFNID